LYVSDWPRPVQYRRGSVRGIGSLVKSQRDSPHGNTLGDKRIEWS
jgi:hypothetical protein